MSAELVHLSCWALLASMVVFLVIGGTRTFREYRQLMRDRRAKRKAFQRGPVCRVSEKAFRYA